MRRALLGVVVAGALVWLTGAPAAAHASLLSTDPDEGSVVATVPGQVVLSFNQPVRVDTVHAFAADGQDWSVEAKAQDNRVVVTPQEDPGTGTVVVAWKVISEDGHVVGGALTFSIGAPSQGRATAVASGAPTETSTGARLARAVALLAVAVSLVGLLVLSSVVGVRGAVPARWTHHGVRRGLSLLWDVAFIGAVLLIPLQQVAAAGGGLGDMVDWLTWLDGLGRGSTLLVLAAVLVAGALPGLVRRIARPVSHGSPALLRAVVGIVAVAALVPAVVGVVVRPEAVTAKAAPNPDPGPRSADLGSAGRVTVSARPAKGRSIALSVELTDVDGKPLRPFAEPTLTVRNAEIDLGAVALESAGAGRYQAEVVIPRGGEWKAQVSVRTTEFDNPVAIVPFRVG